MGTTKKIMETAKKNNRSIVLEGIVEDAQLAYTAAQTAYLEAAHIVRQQETAERMARKQAKKKMLAAHRDIFRAEMRLANYRAIEAAKNTNA